MSDRRKHRPKYVAAMQLEHPEIFALEAERGIDPDRVNSERAAEELALALELERKAAAERAQLTLF